MGGDGAIFSESNVLPDIRVDAHVDSDMREGVMVGERRENDSRSRDRREMEGEEESEGTEPEREGGGTPYEHDEEVMTASPGNGQKLLSPEFAFEDGSVLQDYPSSMDLEVISNSENTHRAHFIGRKDIYNSWILQASSTQHQEHLTECSSDQSIKCSPALEVKENTSPTIPALVVQQTNVQEKEVGSSQAHNKAHKIPPASPSLEEAQVALDKSVADLLELTITHSQEAQEISPPAGSEERGYCSLKEHQSLCDNKRPLHKVTPTSHVPPHRSSVPCLLKQVSQEDGAVSTTSSLTPSFFTQPPRKQASQSSPMLEQRVVGDLTLDLDTQNTSLSTEDSEDLLLISHL